MTHRILTLLLVTIAFGCSTHLATRGDVVVELTSAVASEKATDLHVKISNSSSDTFFFRAPEEGVLTPLVQQKIGGEWQDKLVVCFTGSQTFAVDPGETVELRGSVPAHGLIRVGVPDPYSHRTVWSNGLRVDVAPN